MKKSAKTPKPIDNEKTVYRLYDAETQKYVSNIMCGSWYYGKARIVFSNAPKSVILSFNDLSKFYKKVFDLKNRRLYILQEAKKWDLTKTKPAPAYDKKHMKKELKTINAVLKRIQKLELQQFNLTPANDTDKLARFKEQSISKLSKSILRNHIVSKYGYITCDWFLKSFKKEKVKYPYAIVEFGYSFASKNGTFEELKKHLKHLGISAKWFGHYSNQVCIDTIEDYHLFCLSVSNDKIQRRFIVSDMVDDYNNILKDITDFSSKQW